MFNFWVNDRSLVNELFRTGFNALNNVVKDFNNRDIFSSDLEVAITVQEVTPVINNDVQLIVSHKELKRQNVWLYNDN